MKLKAENKQTPFYLITIGMLLCLLAAKLFDLHILSSPYTIFIFMVTYLLVYIDKIKYSRFGIIYLLSYLVINMFAIYVTGKYKIGTVLFEGMIIIVYFMMIPSIIEKEDQVTNLFKVINLLCLGIFLLRVLSLSSFEDVYIINHKNGHGQTMLISIFFSFYLYRRGKRKFYLLCSLLYLFSLITTLSRTAMVANLVFFILYFCLTQKRNFKRNIIITGLLVLCFTVFFVMNYQIINEFITENIIRNPNDLLSGRGRIWRVGFQVFGRNPIFGAGRGTAEDFILSHREYHNYYLDILATQGLMNFLFFIIISYKALKSSASIYRSNREVGAIYISAFSSIFVYMLAESFNPYYFGYNNLLSALFIYIIPLSYTKNRNWMRLDITEKF